jgi:hypothetical protein
MRLTEETNKIKTIIPGSSDLSRCTFIVLAVVLITIGVFMTASILEANDHTGKELRVVQNEITSFSEGGNIAPLTTNDLTMNTKAYVAARMGTVYYLPWCGGAKRISDENKVWFSTKEEAQMRGYHPARNCKGI